jgi:hypothetical protein
VRLRKFQAFVFCIALGALTISIAGAAEAAPGPAGSPVAAGKQLASRRPWPVQTRISVHNGAALPTSW